MLHSNVPVCSVPCPTAAAAGNLPPDCGESAAVGGLVRHKEPASVRRVPEVGAALRPVAEAGLLKREEEEKKCNVDRIAGISGFLPPIDRGADREEDEEDLA